MSNTKIQHVKVSGTTYDIDLPSDATIDVSSITTDKLTASFADSSNTYQVKFGSAYDSSGGFVVVDGTDTGITLYPTSSEQLYVYDDASGNEGYYTFRTGISGTVATLDDITGGGSSYTLSGSGASVTLNKDGTAQNTVTVNNVANATTATKLGSTTVGASNKPIYLSSGTATASTSTIGSGVKPIYMSSGTIYASSTTVGGAHKPVYLNAGTITACSDTIGSSTLPAYMSSGTLAAITYPSSNASFYTSVTSGTFTQPAGGVIASYFGGTSSSGVYSGIIDLSNNLGIGFMRFGKFTKAASAQSAKFVTFAAPMRGSLCAKDGVSHSLAYSTYGGTYIKSANTTYMSVVLQDGTGAASSEWSNSHKVTSVTYTGFTYYHGASESITVYYIAMAEAN